MEMFDRVTWNPNQMNDLFRNYPELEPGGRPSTNIENN
jgi:hypothetical protein